VLIFDQIFNTEKDYYKCREKNTDPLNAAVVSVVQVFILNISIGNNGRENDYKKNCKYELSFAEHIFYFCAKLI
jgi:hypothetical protein